MKNYLNTVRLIFGAGEKILFQCICVVLLLIAFELAVPLFMQYMINQVESNQNLTEFLLLLGCFVLMYLALCILNGKRAELYQYVGKNILWGTRKKVYDVLWKSDYTKYIANDKDRLRFVLSTETYLAFAITTVYTFNLFINMIIVAMLLGLAFYMNLYVGIVLFAAFLLTLFFSFFSGKRMMDSYARFDDEKEKDLQYCNENVDMIEVVRTNGLMEYYLEKNRKNLDQFIVSSAESERTEAFWSSVQNAIHGVIYVIASGILILSPGFGGGQLVMLLYITNYLLEASQQFQKQLQVIIKNLPVFDKLAQVMETPLNQGKHMEEIEQIEFQNVTLMFNDNRRVLDHLSFEIHKGDHVILEGENGSGKSTILKLITGLLEPTDGSILLNGKDISDYDKSLLYRQICYVSQDELILNETVEKYLSIITHKTIGSELMKQLRERVRLTSEIDQITDNGVSLSGGEKKKLLILKTLLSTEQNIIILDDIDAGLDIQTRTVLKEIEKEIAENPEKTLIKISHIDREHEGFNKVIRI